MTGDNDSSAPSSPDPTLSTYEQIRGYLATTHRADIKKDTDQAVEKLNNRIDATQMELSAHKAKMNEELINIKSSIQNLGGQNQAQITYASVSAAANGSNISTVRNMNSISQEVRMYQMCQNLSDNGRN